MSHDLDKTTGKAAMAYVGEAPWHGLGTKLEKGASLEEWIRAARLDWELRMMPVTFPWDGASRIVPDRFVLARSDSGDGLSIVSSDYHIVQPREVLEFYRELVAERGFTLETAGALAGGRKVWALARTGRVTPVAGDDKDRIAAFVLLATSCDKSLATTAAFTSVRVVCSNTLNFAMEDIADTGRRAVKIRHTRRFEASDVQARLGLLDRAWERFLERVNRLAKEKLTFQGAENLFDKIMLPERRSEASGLRDERNPGRLSEQAEREKQKLIGLYNSAPGQELSTAKGTLWGAVNAVAYYVDHVKAAGTDQGLDSAWFGRGREMKDKAWRLAMELVPAGG